MAGREQHQAASATPAVEDRGAPEPPPADGVRRRRPTLAGFLAEVRRRQVPRASLAYLVAAFGILQGLQVLMAAFGLPGWVLTSATVLAVVGFPVNLLLAWYIDVGADAERALPGSPWSPERRIRLRKPTWAAVGIMSVAVAGLAAWQLWPRPAPQEKGPPGPQTVLIADFENRTGDGVFDGTLEPALAIAMEGASFITSFNRAAALRTADKLRFQGSGLSEARARLVAQREGISVVTAGAIERAGSGYRVVLRALDAITGTPIVERTEEVGGKEGVLGAATKLAAGVRAALGDATPESVQLTAGETFSAASLEAAHAYALGNAALHAGRWDESAAHFQEALKLDPGLGRAHAGLAVLEYNRGHRAESERWFKEAMANVDRMTEREKFRSRGLYYVAVDRDPDKAIEAFSALVERYPADNAGHANLAVAYQLKRDFARALEHGRKAIAISPRNVQQRSNVGLFAMFAGDHEAAVREQTTVLEANPAYVEGYVGLALAQLAAGRRDDALATWTRLAAVSETGASTAAEGLADLAAYEGRLADAAAALEKGLEADRRRKDADAAARKLAFLGEVLLAQRQPARAAAAATKALATGQGSESTMYAAAAVLARGGDERRARAVADELDRRLPAESRMYAALIRGELELQHRRFPEAIQHFRAAAQRVDAWIVHRALGRAYLEAGSTAQAHEELERCEKRRGEATDAFLETVPTFRLYPPVLVALGRALEGLGSPAAADAYRSYLALKRGDEDPEVADARRRLAAR